ncbi:hypothetical protein GCM10011416_17260 [Polaribacter pacificus]|uniref:Glycosyl transferase family 1 domain-containing protein n=1 Tax=Polaribacter pacificus TaxID=1775173 RepID=A0A917HZF0_9FLAO|nr:glycosyltransferase family 4 protein [Polaribacter pacificus]GGG99493.1 hypothetical protein GCM10011416_17260 [Polaribacter pacificus]
MTKSVLYIGNNLSKKSGYPTTLETLSDRLVQEGYKLYKFSDKENKLIRLLDMCWAVIRLRKDIDYVMIDTFSTTNFYFSWLTSQIARLYKLRYIPILHGGNLPQRLDKSPRLSKQLFQNSYMNIAPSNYLKYEFEQRGFQAELIPNIVEVEQLKFKHRKNLTPSLLWVRSFRTLYNPMMAIEVLHHLTKEYPKARLCMVGPVNDSSFDLVLELVKKYDLKNNVEFTGILSKEDWFKKAEEFDFFINTTNFDNTPISILEAMGLGLVIVSTNAGGMPYLIENGHDGVLVDKGDSEQMAAEIIKLIRGEKLEISVNAREKVMRFGWGFIRNQWIKVLR